MFTLSTTRHAQQCVNKFSQRLFLNNVRCQFHTSRLVRGPAKETAGASPFVPAAGKNQEKKNAFKSQQKFARNADTFEAAKAPEMSDLYVQIPGRKSPMLVPNALVQLGDQILSLSMIEQLALQEYIRHKMGIDKEIPDPITAMLQSNQFAFLTSLPHVQNLNNMVNMAMMPLMSGMSGMVAQAAPVAAPAAQAAPATPAAAAPAAEAPKEEKKEEKKVEKSSFNVKLESYKADAKINIIKELRKLDKNLSIKDAKDMVEAVPGILKKEMPKEDAQKFKEALEAAGAVVVLE